MREREGRWNHSPQVHFLEDHCFSKEHMWIYVGLLLAARIDTYGHSLAMACNQLPVSFHPLASSVWLQKQFHRVVFHATVCGREDGDSSPVRNTPGSASFSARSIRKDPKVGEALGRGWSAPRLSKCKSTRVILSTSLSWQGVNPTGF